MARSGSRVDSKVISVIIESMSIEPNECRHRQASLHAVLADEARLAIVETLLLGDASPGELAALTDMPSNLVAHHLGVLEARGLISRRRSEGDRRRTYVNLVGDELETLGVSATATADRVLFVCTANSARSQFAAALWRRASGVPAVSAGTRPAARIHPRTIETADRHQLRLPRRRPRDLASVRQPGDLVVCVCDQAYEELQRPASADRAPVHWSVADPVRIDTDKAFEEAFDAISARVRRLAAAIPVL
jgi:ArsR family transcriptional regulator, arsenate/arsenite/antimonite-responsive transcriptional repressor / arsenate reductase (thioredoxin)